MMLNDNIYDHSVSVLIFESTDMHIFKLTDLNLLYPPFRLTKMFLSYSKFLTKTVTLLNCRKIIKTPCFNVIKLGSLK